jgi:hypothetical protein
MTGSGVEIYPTETTKSMRAKILVDKGRELRYSRNLWRSGSDRRRLPLIYVGLDRSHMLHPIYVSQDPAIVNQPNLRQLGYDPS